MTVRRILGALLLAAAGLPLGAHSARAGSKSISTPLLYVDANDLYTCAVVNLGHKTVANVNLVLRRWNGPQLSAVACGALAPGASCPTGPSSSPSALTWLRCEVTADGKTKDLRVTFQNIDTGATVQAP